MIRRRPPAGHRPTVEEVEVFAAGADNGRAHAVAADTPAADPHAARNSGHSGALQRLNTGWKPLPAVPDAASSTIRWAILKLAEAEGDFGADITSNKSPHGWKSPRLRVCS